MHEKLERWKRPSIIAVGFILTFVSFQIFRGPSRSNLEGRVTCLGKPVTVGTVIVLAVDGSMLSTPLEADGRYHVANVPKGPVKLGVISRDPAKVVDRRQRLAAPSDRLSGDDRFVAAPAPVGKWFPVPVKFEDPKYSGIETTLTKKVAFDIELK